MSSNFITSFYHDNNVPSAFSALERNSLPLKPVDYRDAQASYTEPKTEEEQWSWASMVWSILVILLCPAFTGCMMIAIIFNGMAYVDHKTGDYQGKKRKLQCSFWWTVGTLILAVISFIIVMIVLFVVERAQDWTSLPFGLATD